MMRNCYAVKLKLKMLGTKLAHKKPSDPNAFLISELTKMSEMKKAGTPITLFEESDIITMFSVFDITGRGYVDHTQYFRALEAVGIDSTEADVNKPNAEHIDRNTFVRYV